MTTKQIVNAMMCEASMAGIAFDAGNMIKAAYWYGQFMAHKDSVEYADIVEYTEDDERSKAIDTIYRITDKILEAAK